MSKRIVLDCDITGCKEVAVHELKFCIKNDLIDNSNMREQTWKHIDLCPTHIEKAFVALMWCGDETKTIRNLKTAGLETVGLVTEERR